MPTRRIAALMLRRLARPSHDPSFRRALAAFVERARGLPAAVPSLEDGARSLAAVLAAEESARTGAPVSLGTA
jgi:predicted dehydrogenase